MRTNFAKFGFLASAIVSCTIGCGVENESPSLSVGAQGTTPQVIQHVARGNLQFVHGYEAGKREAAERRRPMMVYFSADWGDYCALMERETFTNREIMALSDQFVLVLVDADQQHEICNQFNVSGYPMLQFLSPAGLHLGRVEGKQPDDMVLRAMRAALRASHRSIAEGGEDLRR
jgi:thiol:disulfide interchange protein